mmetsp:Transcript_37733/g.107810  ORF Transcript_37733/g.107810 Transcript_37733/m.107810 type:complete len:330 (+) Transcript_37733:24-1013(+)
MFPGQAGHPRCSFEKKCTRLRTIRLCSMAYLANLPGRLSPCKAPCCSGQSFTAAGARRCSGRPARGRSAALDGRQRLRREEHGSGADVGRHKEHELPHHGHTREDEHRRQAKSEEVATLDLLLLLVREALGDGHADQVGGGAHDGADSAHACTHTERPDKNLGVYASNRLLAQVDQDVHDRCCVRQRLQKGTAHGRHPEDGDDGDGHAGILWKDLYEGNDPLAQHADDAQLRERLHEHEEQREEEQRVPLDKFKVLAKLVPLKEDRAGKHAHAREPGGLNLVHWREQQREENRKKDRAELGEHGQVRDAVLALEHPEVQAGRRPAGQVE